MASLYNSSTGVLKVNNLEASGNITAKGYGQFGHAHIGTWGNDYAMFSHNKFKSEGSSYSMLQGSNGDTFINSKDTVYLRKNNNDADDVRIKNGNITATGNVTAEGNVTSKGDILYKTPSNEEIKLKKYGIEGLKIDVSNLDKILKMSPEKNINVRVPLAGSISGKIAVKYKDFVSNDDLYKNIDNKLKNKQYKKSGNTITFT